MSRTPQVLMLSSRREVASCLRAANLEVVREASAPALVLLDLDAGDDAPEAIRRARARHPDAPVLVLSEDSRPHRVVDAIRAGAHDWIPLPLDEDALLTSVRETLLRRDLSLEGRRMLRFLREQVREVEEDRRLLTRRVAAMGEELQTTHAQLESAHRQLQNRVAQLVMLYKIGRDLSTQRNWDQALSTFLKNLCDFLGAQGAALLLSSREGRRLSPRCAHGDLESSLDGLCRLLGEVGGEPRFPEPSLFPVSAVVAGEWAPCSNRKDAWSETLVPLVHRRRVLGYLLFGKDYASASEIHDDLYFLITIQTILTEEVAAAQSMSALRKLERFHQRTLDHVDSGILTLDAHGRLLYANAKAQELLGGARVGRPLDSRLTVGSERTPLARWLAGLGEKEPGVAEGWLMHSEDRAIPVSLHTSRLPGELPGEHDFVAILEDLRGKRDLEAERRRAARQDELLIMAAEWAHDVRTPLTGILHSAELLVEALPRGSPKRRHFDVVRGEVQRINELVSNFLDFARPARLKRTRGEVDALAREAVEFLRGPAAQREVALKLIVEGAGPFVAEVDGAQLRQVLLNLVTNALEASASGDEVIVRLRLERTAPELAHAVAHGDALSLEVQDQGPGVSAEHIDRLFIPFFTTKSHGSGLGLAISEKVVRAHHGHLRYERRDGRTIMRAVLPVSSSQPSPVPRAARETPLEARG